MTVRPGRATELLLAGALVFSVAGCRLGGARVKTLVAMAPVVTSVARVGDDVWIGSWAGLTRFSKGRAELFGENAGLPKGAQVRYILASGRLLWLATNLGVVQFSVDKGKAVRTWTSRDGLGSDSVRCVTEARGVVWAGTIFGVSRLDAGARRWRNYRIAQGLTQDHVYAVAEEAGQVWASCINGGMVRFEPARDRWVAIPQDHGLGNKHNYAILPAGGSLWLGTAAGVNLYHVDTGKWDAAVCDDGFTDYCVRSLALTGEHLWFGTSYGLYRRNLKTGKQVVWTKNDGLPDDEVSQIVVDGPRLLVAVRTGVAEVILPR